MSITIRAPFTLEPIALSTSYIGGNAEYEIHGARRIYVGLTDSGALVAGVAKVRWAHGGSVEIPIPADNMLPLDDGGGGELPVIRLDIKAASGTPNLVLMAL